MPEPNDKTVEETKDDKDTNTRTLKVNGTERQVTDEELLELAQKGAAADETWRNAHTEKTEAKKLADTAEAAIAGMEALRTLHQNPQDLDAYRQVRASMGASQEDIETEITGMQADTPQAERTEATTAVAPVEKTAPVHQKTRFEDLPLDVQELLREQAGKKTEEQIREEIVKDPILGKEYKGDQSQRDKSIEGLVKNAVRERVLLRKQTFGSQVVRDAIQEVRQTMTDLGTQGGTDSASRAPGHPGLGRTPAGGQRQDHSGPPKRVAMSEPGYNEYINLKLQYEQLKADG